MARKEKAPKARKPIFKRWWFWLLIALILVGIFGGGKKDGAPAPQAATEPNTTHSEAPTEAPTVAPTAEPTEAPTAEPTEAPTAEPTEAPTAEPTEAPTEAPTPEPTATSEPTPEPNRKDVLSAIITDHVTSEYIDTEIESISINDDYGTDAPDDYIALVRLVWNVKNKRDTAREVLRLYSDDLAAYLAEQCSDVQEVAVFWTVPYLDNASAKLAYERKGNGMAYADDVWTGALQ